MDIQHQILNKLPSYELSKEEEKVLTDFVQNIPVGVLSDELNKIVKQDKIQANDIPIIIHTLANFYHEQAIQSNYKDTKFIMQLLQISLDTILESQWITLSDVEKEAFEMLIDNSLYLLQMNIEIKPKKCWLSQFFPYC